MEATVVSSKNRQTADLTFVTVEVQNEVEVDGFPVVTTERGAFQLKGHLADRLPVGTVVIGQFTNEMEISPSFEGDTGLKRFGFGGLKKADKKSKENAEA